MGALLFRALGVTAAVACLTSREAAAMGVVIGSSEDPVAIASARVAVAASPARTVRWAQIRVTSDKSSFAWLLPVAPGARIDLASDAWLDALDAATVPVVRPPASPTACPVSTKPELLAPLTSPSSRAPLQSFLALDAPSLTTFVDGNGFEIPAGLSSTLGGVFVSGSAVLALVYAPGALPVHTVRILDDGPATLPLALTGSLAGAVSVTAFVLAGGARQAGSSPLTVDPKAVRWFADGSSSYATEAASLIAGSGDDGWLTESSEPSAFFEQTPIEPGLGLPSAIDDYYLLASDYGDTSADPSACSAGASSTLGTTSGFAAACPPGALATVPGSSPCVLSPSDATPITPLLCGSAVDAALAVGNLKRTGVWLTRVEGVVTSHSAADVPIGAGGTTPDPIILTAGGFGTACGLADAGAPEGGGWGSEGGPNDEGGFGGGEGGGGSGDGSALSLGGEGGVSFSSIADVAGATSDGCGSSSTSADVGSSGCSGDTSSSDSGGSGCGGGSSSSSSDTAGCSGGSSSSNNCSTSGHGRRPRSPVSRGVLVAAVILGVLRRLRLRRSPIPGTK